MTSCLAFQVFCASGILVPPCAAKMGIFGIKQKWNFPVQQKATSSSVTICMGSVGEGLILEFPQVGTGLLPTPAGVGDEEGYVFSHFQF